MTDFLNKIIAIILIFLMLVVAPMLISYKIDEALDKRNILNDVETFLDVVTDVKGISEEELDQLYINCNSYGMLVDVSVKVYMKTAVPDGADAYKYYYQALYNREDIKAIAGGSIVKVEVKEIGLSGMRRLQHTLLGYDDGSFKLELAKAVM